MAHSDLIIIAFEQEDALLARKALLKLSAIGICSD